MIDEKKLIEEIEERHRYWENCAAEYDETGDEVNMDICDGKAIELHTIIKHINEQPKVGEWIPCSERLPEEEAKEFIKEHLNGIGYLYPCLLTYRSPNTEKINVVRFYYDLYQNWFVNLGEKPCEKDRCLAWQPLPEPWEGEK